VTTSFHPTRARVWTCCLLSSITQLMVAACASGPIVLADGSRYEGATKGGVAHGSGTRIWPDGRRFVGESKDGFMEGTGSFHWPNGDLYVGDFRADDMNGRGVFTSSRGHRYEGEFRDGMKHGKGHHIVPGGNECVGDALARAIDRRARKMRASLNKAVIRLLEEATGLAAPDKEPVRHHDLDPLAGSWSPEEADVFDRSLEELRAVDGEVWR